MLLLLFGGVEGKQEGMCWLHLEFGVKILSSGDTWFLLLLSCLVCLYHKSRLPDDS